MLTEPISRLRELAARLAGAPSQAADLGHRTVVELGRRFPHVPVETWTPFAAQAGHLHGVVETSALELDDVIAQLEQLDKRGSES